MSDSVLGAAEAIKGIVQSVPVYQDVLQPAAKEVGEGLRQAVTIALKPLKVLVWGFDQIEAYVVQKIPIKLAEVPPDQVLTPSALVAGPAIEALRFAGSSPELAEMFAELLASSMHPGRAALAHPAFVEVIKQMLPDEARLLRHMIKLPYITALRLSSSHSELGGPDGRQATYSWAVLEELYSPIACSAACESPELVSLYLANLIRLGLLESSEVPDYPPELMGDFDVPYLRKVVEAEQAKGWFVEYRYYSIGLTGTGHRFIRACVNQEGAIHVGEQG